jgi:hypothetical protein
MLDMLMLKWEVLEDANVQLSDKANQPGGKCRAENWTTAAQIGT